MKDWVDDLPLSVRVKNVIRNEGLASLDEACRMTDRQWAMVPNCGPKTLFEIIDALEKVAAQGDIEDADWW